MKHIVFLVVSLCLNVTSCVTQSTIKDPPRPPAPLIFDAPRPEDLKEFIPADKAFRIVFPGLPKSSNDKSDGILTTKYVVTRNGSDLIVDVNE